MLVDYVVKEVNVQLQADVARKVFRKEGEIQNATTNNLIDRYSHFQSALEDATIIKYENQIAIEQQQQILTGNIMSAAGAIFMVLLLMFLLILFVKK